MPKARPSPNRATRASTDAGSARDASEAINVLIARLAADGRTPLHRTICATLARALDALVRDGTCEPVDVMLVAAAGANAADISTLGEASMDPDVCGTLRAYARFVQMIEVEEPLLLAQPPPTHASSEVSAAALHRRRRRAESEGAPTASKALLDFSASLGDDGSGRADALRAVLGRVGRALRQMDVATSRKSLVDSSGTGIDAARRRRPRLRRWSARRNPARARRRRRAGITMAVAAKDGSRCSRIAEPPRRVCQGRRRRRSARRRSSASSAALGRLVGGPRARSPAAHEGGAPPLALARFSAELRLAPDRAARSAASTSCVRSAVAARPRCSSPSAPRSDHERAELFALKVPDYDGAAARSLSEQEFLEFFRAEASALLGLPPDPNLARFVTFDLGARPKPILVMELIEGPTLERFVSASDGGSRKQTAERALSILDGVLAGLEVMHRHTIGHLDVKPSNVILREGKTPTLVDFGLAGRHLRPGCATGYGAPEVWGREGFVGEPSPSRPTSTRSARSPSRCSPAPRSSTPTPRSRSSASTSRTTVTPKRSIASFAVPPHRGADRALAPPRSAQPVDRPAAAPHCERHPAREEPSVAARPRVKRPDRRARPCPKMLRVASAARWRRSRIGGTALCSCICNFAPDRRRGPLPGDSPPIKTIAASVRSARTDTFGRRHPGHRHLRCRHRASSPSGAVNSHAAAWTTIAVSGRIAGRWDSRKPRAGRDVGLGDARTLVEACPDWPPVRAGRMPPSSESMRPVNSTHAITPMVNLVPGVLPRRSPASSICRGGADVGDGATTCR